MPIYREKLVQLDTLNVLVFEIFYCKHEYFCLLLIYCYYIFGIWNTMYLHPWYEQRHTPLSHSLYILTLCFTPYQTFLDTFVPFIWSTSDLFIFSESCLQSKLWCHDMNISIRWLHNIVDIKKNSGFETHVGKPV